MAGKLHVTMLMKPDGSLHFLDQSFSETIARSYSQTEHQPKTEVIFVFRPIALTN